MDQLERAAGLKGELVDFALSGRFSRALDEVVEDSLPDGVLRDEDQFAAVIEDLLFNHRLPDGDRVVERFVATRDDLSEDDKALLLGWLDYVQGIFEVREPYGEDGVIAFNHIDELTYRLRSNLGKKGVEALPPGVLMIGGIVPVGDEWMISGMPSAIPADQTEPVLAEVPRLALNFPERVFRNPEKLAQARRLQEEQRQAFIDLYGSDLIVVPGPEIRSALLAFYRRAYERAGSRSGPWTEPDLPPLPEELTDADSVALIYDSADGLGFYPDFALAQEAFAKPRLVVRRRYHEVISGYLRTEGMSPVPIRRLVESHPESADEVFRKLLKKPGFAWDRDGEALLRRYKAEWYARPALPRVLPASVSEG